MDANSFSSETLQRRYPHNNSLLDSLPFGIVYQDSQGQIISANPAAEKILGLSRDQMFGVTSLDPRWRTIHEDGSPFPGSDHPSMVSLRTGKSLMGIVMGVFNPMRHELSWIKVSAIPITDDSNNSVVGVYSIFEDISEFKLATNKQKESEHRFYSLFSTMLEGVALHRIIYNAHGTPIDYLILEINQAFEKHTGLKKAAVLNHLASEVFGVQEPPFLEIYAQVERTQIGTTFEHYFAPLNKYFLINAFSPEPGHFATVFEDITERKQIGKNLEFHSKILNNLAEGIYLR